MKLEAPVFDMAGQELRRELLPPSVFGVTPNQSVMYQALVRQLSNARRGTHRTQTRSEVSRTGRKWYRQKGTGRARHGDRTANVFVGGGVVHGPVHRTYRQRMPKRMRRLALRSALSAKAAEEAVVCVDGLAMDAPQTRVFARLVEQACGGRRTLVVLADRNEAVERSIRNLPHVRYLRAAYLNVRDLLGHERLMLDLAVLDHLVAHLGDRVGPPAEAGDGGGGDASD